MNGTSSAERFDLGEQFFDAMMRADPVYAHTVGEYQYAGRWRDVSQDAEDARLAELRDFARRAEAINPASLDDQERITREVLVSEAKRAAELVSIRMPSYGADPIMGAQANAPRDISMLSMPDAHVADRVIEMIRSLGEHFAALAQRQREGVATGLVAARCAAEATLAQVEGWLDARLVEDPLLVAIAEQTDKVNTTWFEAASRAVAEVVRPGLATYRDVLRDDVLPAARDDGDVGLCRLPDGELMHAKALHSYTTTDLTAAAIHDEGHTQLARLADEYRSLGAKALGTRDLDAIWSRLRLDPSLRVHDAVELIGIAENALRRAEDALPGWFELTPGTPCEIREQRSGLKAQFHSSSLDGSRGATVYFNTSDVAAWGRFEVESILFHESVPGHHEQFTVAARLQGIPRFRRHAYVHSYSEGWALYSERLADEMGLYSTPLDCLGMLAADSMRACRMVIDTGMHAFGWSRSRAIRFMLDNSPLSEGVVVPEIDRYIIDPGQSPSYMIGRLEIQRIRREAEERQGAAFDLRGFHTAVLDGGSVPMGTLDCIIRSRMP